MTTIRVARANLPFLTDGQWKALREALQEPREWMAHSLGNKVEIGHTEAHAVCLVLGAVGQARLR